jgi:hypothetical protein
MPYTISTVDGTVPFNIPDGQFNTTSSLTLPGPNTPGWGGYHNQNLLNLLTNFASNSSQKPSGQSLHGQLWYDETHEVLNVYNPTTGYVPVSGILVDPIQPVSGTSGVTVGTIWYNSTTNQMNMCTSIGPSPTHTPAFTLIGPLFTSQQGPSGAIPTVVNDASVTGVTHNILQLQFGNIVVATVSSSAAFSPSPSIPGFQLIQPGLTVSTLYHNPILNYANINVAAYLPTDPTITGINSTIANIVVGSGFATIAQITAANVAIENILVGSGFANIAQITAVNDAISSTNANVTTIDSNVSAYETWANASISATNANITAANAAISVIAMISMSLDYTLTLADVGVLHPSADVTARTFTIDRNANVAYPLYKALTFINQNAAGVVTIAINGDTMRLSPAGTTGNRTLAANGVATAVKLSATEWIISGTGLT